MKKVFDEMQLNGLRNALLDAPVPARKLTQKEAVVELLPTLKELQGRGHTINSLVDLMALNGVTINARVLTSLMRGAPGKSSVAKQRRVTTSVPRISD